MTAAPMPHEGASPEPQRPARADLGKPCTCGHGRRAHEHYRRGTDCALCDCPKFHRPLLRRLFHR